MHDKVWKDIAHPCLDLPLDQVPSSMIDQRAEVRWKKSKCYQKFKTCIVNKVRSQKLAKPIKKYETENLEKPILAVAVK